MVTPSFGSGNQILLWAREYLMPDINADYCTGGNQYLYKQIASGRIFALKLTIPARPNRNSNRPCHIAENGKKTVRQLNCLPFKMTMKTLDEKTCYRNLSDIRETDLCSKRPVCSWAGGLDSPIVDGGPRHVGDDDPVVTNGLVRGTHRRLPEESASCRLLVRVRRRRLLLCIGLVFRLGILEQFQRTGSFAQPLDRDVCIDTGCLNV